MTWSRFKKFCYQYPALGLSLDLSRMPFPDGFLESMEPKFQQAFADMAALEKGAIANPDENRMVGHYWLRAPQLAPNDEIANAITSTLAAIKDFAAKVHQGEDRRAGRQIPRATDRRHRRIGPRPAVRQLRPSAGSRAAATECAFTSSTTPIPTAWISC